MSYSYSRLNTYLKHKEDFTEIIDIIENGKKEICDLMQTIRDYDVQLFSQLDGYTDGSSGHLAQTYDGKLDIVKRKAVRIYDYFNDAYETLCSKLKVAKNMKTYYARKAEEEKRGLEEMEREAEVKSINLETNISLARQYAETIVKGVTKNGPRI